MMVIAFRAEHITAVTAFSRGCVFKIYKCFLVCILMFLHALFSSFVLNKEKKINLCVHCPTNSEIDLFCTYAFKYE